MVKVPHRADIGFFLRAARKAQRVRSAVLFGSVAKGTYGVGSDIDLLVIAQDLPENFLKRLKVLYDANKTKAPLEIFPYTPDEFLLMIRKAHPTALDALNEGKILYDDGFFESMRKKFETLKQERGLVRTSLGWEMTV